MNLREIEEFSIALAKGSGDILRKYFGKIENISTKSTGIDLVTIADLESEKYITDAINSRFPDHDIIAEEGENTKAGSRYRWVIDPLDGTTNFVHNIPIFAISIAFQIDGKTSVAAIYNPGADKMFSAVLGAGAKLNGETIKCTSTNTLSESLLVTGFPYVHDTMYDRLFDIFKQFYDASQGVRRFGAAALDLCFVAMGRFEGFYEFGLKEWDIAAGTLILTESGGTISDWDGSECPSSGVRVLATNGGVHSSMIKVLSQHHKHFISQDSSV